MKMDLKEGLKAFKASYLKKNFDGSVIESFRDNLYKYYTFIDNARDREEEYLKNITNDFLKNTFYGYPYMINTARRIDSAIIKDDKTLAFFEFKRPTNSNEMIQLHNINKRALHEAVFYYLGERINNANLDLKKIIITDTINWFIFDSQDFGRIFYNSLNKIYKDFIDSKLAIYKNEEFFSQVVQPFFENKKEELDYIYFNLDEICKKKNNLTEIKFLYKVFNPDFLMKEYNPQDTNVLNKNFYNELLYIMGLKEKSEQNKTLIVRDTELNNSFLDVVYNKLITEKNITEKDAEDVALELVISWINRILFIKLFESQLITFNNNNSAFEILNTEKIQSFKDLNNLFIQVLNKRNRDAEYKKFDYIPYLNSSLFEISDYEDRYFAVSSIDNNSIKVKERSNLKNWGKYQKGYTPMLLEYLLDFLKSYNFSTHIENDLLTENKEIINASVLGLIFEKINGYKDGAVYTPGLITEYMAKESIEKVLIDKFNEKYSQSCNKLDEVKFIIQTQFNSIEKRKEVSELINSIKICDPAVGSGHFLVSALNQLIAIKYYLGVIFKYQTNDILNEYEILVVDDILTIVDGEDKPFVYDKRNKLSQQIQQTLFNEKKVLIENCLFGVDINSKSVQICRLRLWIELLKNAYYNPDGTMETLPNIDINIKCGNSLTSNIAFEVGKAGSSNLGNQISRKVNEYRDLVAEYKETSDKNKKREVNNKIKTIYSLLEQSYSVQLQFKDETTLNLLKDAGKLSIRKYETIGGALEWAIAFPEILSSEGKFLGFDLVIGNPPYGVPIKGDFRQKVEKNLGKVPDYEIYYYFIELGYKLLTKQGTISYIVPNTYLFNTFAEKYRESLLTRWNLIEILDCSKFSIFDTATVRNTVNTWQKGAFKETGYRNTKDVKSFEELINKPKLTIKNNELLKMNQNWGLAFSLDEEIIDIISKIKGDNKFLNYYFPEISQGLIAYDKYQGQSDEIISTRAYHYNSYSKDGLKKWLWGEDVMKYLVKWNGQEYIDYCDGIANPRQPKYFNAKRILIREITNPSIYAAMTSEELYNDPSVIIVLGNNSEYTETILAILNSKLATFYHFNNSPKATKGAFPKILVKDIKEFPIPNLYNCNTDEIKQLVNNILEITNNADYFKDEQLQKQVSEYQSEIDKLVYQLYNLNEEEIKIIEAE